MSRQDLTHIAVVLDRSGSMSIIRDDTIGGFNTFLAEQKAVPGAATFTLAQFDDVYEVVHEAKPLADVPPLNRETFMPRASTALLDAIARTINSTGKRLADTPEDQRPGKVVFVIITDGQENASKEFNRQQVFDLITHQREKYGWQFVFLAANQDAIAAGEGMGVVKTSSLTFAANAVGTQRAYSSASANVGNYRTGQSASADFTDEDRKQQKAAGASH